LAYSSLFSDSFWIFCWALSSFSASFFFKNYSSDLRPSYLLFCLSSHYLDWVMQQLRFFTSIYFEFFTIPRGSFWLFSPPRNH
jgi:hypothetical protein